MRATHLNLGSGQRPFQAPFVNVDCQARWNPDVLADIRDLSMFESDSAEIIVLHHVLEHFNLGDDHGLLIECHRVLKTKGSLIVTVPDLKALAEAWLAGRIEDYIFLVNVYGAYMGDEADIHRWGGSKESWMRHLMTLFIPRGASLRPFDWRPIAGADIAKDWWIAGIEVIKH